MYWNLKSIYMQFGYQYPKSSNVFVEHVQLLRGMFGLFGPREMLRSFVAKGMYCLKRVHAPRGKLNVGDKQETADVIEGVVKLRFHNRFICVGVDISIYALLTGGWS